MTIFHYSKFKDFLQKAKDDVTSFSTKPERTTSDVINIVNSLNCLAEKVCGDESLSEDVKKEAKAIENSLKKNTRLNAYNSEIFYLIKIRKLCNSVKHEKLHSGLSTSLAQGYGSGRYGAGVYGIGEPSFIVDDSVEGRKQSHSFHLIAENALQFWIEFSVKHSII